ncbi:hypothetical protein BC940DRAFT_121226 [Gongronella butleri]|nr:hypothetical protein BC940DRAFT_121226 [Gongronella butleri]
MTALTRSARSPHDPLFLFIYFVCALPPHFYLSFPHCSFFFIIALYCFFALDHCPVVFITYFKGIDYKTRLPARPITVQSRI